MTAPGRGLVFEGELTKIGNATVRPDYFFLFETLSAAELLHARRDEETGRFAFKRFLRVIHVEDVELSGREGAEAGGIDRSRLYARRGSIGGRRSSSPRLGGAPGGADDGEEAASLLLRVVAADPSDPKQGHVYSLGGERQALVEWKCKMTAVLSKKTSEWKLRFKGDVAVLGEGFATYAAQEVKDAALARSFMWFFSGKFGGLVVRATSGKSRSGKLDWHEAYRVDRVDGGPVPARSLADSKKFRKRCTGPEVFRIFCRDPHTNNEKVLICASEDRDLVVELMTPRLLGDHDF